MAVNYFFYFAVFGTFMPYLSPVLLSLGFSKQETGQIWAVIHVFGVLNPLLGGRISDRFLSADKMLKLCALSMTGFALLMWWRADTASWPFLLALTAFAAGRAPVISLQDTLAMQVAGSDAQRFTRIRLTGSVSFALAVILYGYLADQWGTRIFFPVVAGFCVLFLFSGIFLPKEQKLAPTETTAQGFWRTLSMSWWLWLLAMMLHWFCFGPYNYGFTLLLQEQKVATWAFGWFWSLGVAAEIAVFAFSGWFFRRFSHHQVLMLAVVCNLVRWLMIGVYPAPWVIGLSQILHGPGFALFWAAALQGIHHYCGGVQRASYQGLFSTCIGGVASMLGTMTAGALHQHMPFREVLLWLLPVQAASLLLLWRFPLTIRRSSV